MIIEKMNNYFLSISIIPIILLLLIPNVLVFGQTSPWSLFQQLCQGGRYATGPQCQGLLQGQQQPSSSTTGTTTSTPSTCATNSVLQNNFCVPLSTSTTTGTYGTATSQPIASAGPSQAVSQGSSVTLVGTGSYSPNGGTIVSYSWTQTSGTPVSLNGANTATPTFTAPTVTASTSLTFSLTVTDNTDAVSSPATVTITVS